METIHLGGQVNSRVPSMPCPSPPYCIILTKILNLNLTKDLIDKYKLTTENNMYRFYIYILTECFVLGCKEMIGTMLPMNSLKEPFKSLVHTMLQMCAYAGTSDVLIVQQMLHICSENHVPDEVFHVFRII